jgi:hypothetical protein
MGRFTKSAVIDDLRARASRVEEEQGFDRRTGTAQLLPPGADESTEALIDRAVAYGLSAWPRVLKKASWASQPTSRRQGARIPTHLYLKPRMRPGRLPSGDRSLSELVFHWGSGLASTCCSVRLLFGACLHSFGGTQAGRTGRRMHPSRSQGRLALADAALLESFQPLIVGPGAGKLAQMCAR